MGVQLPYIIGITGPSCSGKSWLADRLHKDLGKVSGRLSLDDFYLDRSHLPENERGNCNFDEPEAIDWVRLEQVLSDFSMGRSTCVPQYDFATHCRKPDDSELQPAPVILMDGLWLFHHPNVRKWFDLKIYIHADVDLCQGRRLARDTSERGRTYEQVLQQYSGTVAPMQEKYVLPQAAYADIKLTAPILEEDLQHLLLRTQKILLQKPSKL